MLLRQTYCLILPARCNCSPSSAASSYSDPCIRVGKLQFIGVCKSEAGHHEEDIASEDIASFREKSLVSSAGVSAAEDFSGYAICD